MSHRRQLSSKNENIIGLANKIKLPVYHAKSLSKDFDHFNKKLTSRNSTLINKNNLKKDDSKMNILLSTPESTYRGGGIYFKNIIVQKPSSKKKINNNKIINISPKKLKTEKDEININEINCSPITKISFGNWRTIYFI